MLWSFTTGVPLTTKKTHFNLEGVSKSEPPGCRFKPAAEVESCLYASEFDLMHIMKGRSELKVSQLSGWSYRTQISRIHTVPHRTSQFHMDHYSPNENKLNAVAVRTNCVRGSLSDTSPSSKPVCVSYCYHKNKVI